MKRLLLLVAFAISSLSFAQNNTGYHSISLKDKKDSVLGFNFYVDKVYDGRQFKENIGTVQKGAFNSKVLANFQNSLTEEFSDYLSVVCPKEEAKEKIDIRVTDLYVSELTRAMSETGYATLVMDVIKEIDGVSYIVGTYSAETESNGMDVTKKHDERIKKVLQDCLTQYVKTKVDASSMLVFDKLQSNNVREVMTLPSKGVYLTYLDVLNSKPFSFENYQMTNKGNDFFLSNKKNNVEESNYYGFSDGEHFYINVSRYASQKHYSRAEIISNKFFIENVLYNPNNTIAMGAMFGLVGVAIASATSQASVPMLIDCYSGQPIFLSNGTLKSMFAPYPELLKEYKDGKKTNEEIKALLYKYYGEL
jgi:hypothetical protein